MAEATVTQSTGTYADSVLGIWSCGFEDDAKERLNKVKVALDALITPEERAQRKTNWEQHVGEINAERETHGGEKVPLEERPPVVTWVIDEAVKRGVCTAEEAEFLREEFVESSNGLPRVVDLL